MLGDGYEDKYKTAEELFTEGKYEEALEAFKELKNVYKDKEELDRKIADTQNLIKIRESNETYKSAIRFLDSGDYVSQTMHSEIIKADEETMAAQAQMEEIADNAFEQLVDYAKTDAEKKLMMLPQNGQGML